MSRILLTGVVAGLAFVVTAGPARAASQVDAHFNALAVRAEPGYVISATCDAVASAGALQTTVECRVSNGDSSVQTLPGSAVATTLTSTADQGPVTVCVTATALFSGGELVTAEPSCRELVPVPQ